MPVLSPPIYEGRLGRFAELCERRGLDHVVVYADREHSANLSYLTGFDPRFEEAMLIAGTSGRPVIVVGNECVGMAEAAPVDLDVVLYQEFSLPSQPRDRSPSLDAILADAGITDGDRVGIVGWKGTTDPDFLDVPSFIADAVRRAVGRGSVENATDLLIDAADGMRVVNEIEQVVAFEYAACHTSNGVKRLLANLEPGMTEQEAVALLGWNGSPLSCHLMLTAGERARLGLLSPGDRPIERGDPFTVAFGIWGALNCRAGFIVTDSSELDPAIADYIKKLVAPYFETVVEWYEALHVGQTGGVLHDIVATGMGDPFFGIFLNPGHQIHLDEWVNSPVGAGSQIELRSGMALQADIIPATGTAYFTTNIEDGLVIADETLRQDLATQHPDMWERMMRRREFMRDTLGIAVSDDVLPLSNIPAFLPPFILSRDHAMAMS